MTSLDTLDKGSASLIASMRRLNGFDRTLQCNVDDTSIFVRLRVGCRTGARTSDQGASERGQAKGKDELSFRTKKESTCAMTSRLFGVIEQAPLSW